MKRSSEVGMNKAIKIVAVMLVLSASLNAFAALSDSTTTSFIPYTSTNNGAVINSDEEYTTVYLYTNMTTYNSSFTFCSVAPLPSAPAGSGTGAITIYGCPTQSVQIPIFSAVTASNTSLSNCLCKGAATGSRQDSSNNTDCSAVVLGNNVQISTLNLTGGPNAADSQNPSIGSNQPSNLGMSITGVQCLVPVQMYVSTAFLKSIEVAKGVVIPATPVCSDPKCPPVGVPPVFKPTQFVWTIGGQSITVLLSYNGSLPIVGLPQNSCGATGTAVCPFNLSYDVFDQTTKPNDGTLTQAQVNIIIPPGTEYSGTTITFPMCGLGSYPTGYTTSTGHPSC
jgi:hypothetical protein